MNRASLVASRATTLLLAAWVAYAPASSAQRRREPLDVLRSGDSTRFGPGITHATARVLKYQLVRQAHVIVLRVSTDGRIEPVFPERQGDQTSQKPGVHGLSVGEVASSLREFRMEGAPAEGKPGRFDPMSGRSVAAAGAAESESLTYWVLIASDVATPALDLQSSLAGFKPAADRDFVRMLDQLTQVLVGMRTTSWASYVAQAIER